MEPVGRVGKVRAGPQPLCPPVVSDQFRILLAEPAGTDALEAVDELGQGNFGREVHESVDVVVLAVELRSRRRRPA